MTAFLKRTPVLWTLFVAQLVIGALFGVFAEAAGGTLLDTIRDPQAARDLIAGLTPAQRQAHLWITAGLDTLYPLAYGGFFAGMALRFFGESGKWLSLPAFAVILVDLAENTTQALALTGIADGLGAKAILTPAKFGLFMLAAVIALVALIIAIIRLVRSR